MLSKLANISAKKDKLEGSIMLSGEDNNMTTITLQVGVESDGAPPVSKDNFAPDKVNPPTD